MIERVIFPFRGAELGGSHVAAFTLGEALQSRAGIACVVVCPSGTMIESEARRLGFQTVPSGEAPTGSNSLVTDALWAGRRRDILQQAADHDETAIVHCSDINTLRSWGLAARLAALKVVYHHHALNRLWWPPHLVSLSYADAVVCVSDATLTALRGWRRDAVKELNPFLLKSSFGREAARSALLAEFGWPADARIIGWVGNFWRRKRPLFFLETAAELARRDPRSRFVMFGRRGDYALDDIVAEAERLGIKDCLTLPGFRQPVEANIACLDLLLAPAPREPFGRTLVEAIILGTPIVATRGAGHTEILEAWGGGKLSDPTATSTQAADLCEAVLAQSAKITLPAPARRALAQQLEPAQHATRMMEIYSSCARHGATRAAAREAQTSAAGR